MEDKNTKGSSFFKNNSLLIIGTVICVLGYLIFGKIEVPYINEINNFMTWKIWAVVFVVFIIGNVIYDQMKSKK